MDITYLEWNINARGGKDYTIPQFICDYIKPVDIFALVEFCASDGWEYFKNTLGNEYDIYLSPFVSVGYNQVCIGINKKLNYKLKSVKTLDVYDHFKPEFLQVDIELERKNLTIIGTRIKSQEDYETKGKTKTEQLYYLKDHIRNTDNRVLCLGDFNEMQSSLNDIFTPIAECYGPRIVNNYYSFVFENGDKGGLDWILTKNIRSVFNGYADKEKSPYATYYWKFIEETKAYGTLTEKDYLGKYRLPDHAILKGMISL